MKEPLSVQEAAEFVGAKIIGQTNGPITGINEIHKVEYGDLTFVDFEKYYDKALNSSASYILIDREMEPPKGKALLLTDDPFNAYNKLTQRFMTFEPAHKMISDSAEIGEGTIIQPGVFIGNHVKIGKNCIIHANVSINDHSVLGDNVIIQSNAVIGGDAFYFKNRNGQLNYFDKLMTCGHVEIEDNVEIGAGTTIDRGVSGITKVGDGTKIDNLVHIGHGVVIGKKCLIAAQVGIAGKTVIGDEVTLLGQAGVSKALHIGDKATIAAKAGVSKSLEGGKLYMGVPAIEAGKKWREMAIMRNLPDMWEKLKKL